MCQKTDSFILFFIYNIKPSSGYYLNIVSRYTGTVNNTLCMIMMPHTWSAVLGNMTLQFDKRV